MTETASPEATGSLNARAHLTMSHTQVQALIKTTGEIGAKFSDLYNFCS